MTENTTSYNFIIHNIIKPDNTCFSPTYKPDGISGHLKILFSIFIKNKTINTKNKFIFFKESLDHFLIKKKVDEFIYYFYKIQKTYNVLNKFVYNYKYKKANLVVDTDMALNKLEINSKNVMCIFENNAKYLFHINDLIKIINNSLTNSQSFFCQPISVKNPYNNLQFNKSVLYNIYFFIRNKTDYYPELIFKFFFCDFNLTVFTYKYESLLREYIIDNFVYNSNNDTLVKDIFKMIEDFNSFCKKRKLKNKIVIDKDFPKDILIKAMRPYLLLYCKSYLSYNEQSREDALYYVIKKLLDFNKYNPIFGRKIYKVNYCVTTNFKTKFKKPTIVFIDKYIQFNDIEKQNENFLSDHLKCANYINFVGNINNYGNEDSSSDEDEMDVDDDDDDASDNVSEGASDNVSEDVSEGASDNVSEGASDNVSEGASIDSW